MEEVQEMIVYGMRCPKARKFIYVEGHAGAKMCQCPVCGLSHDASATQFTHVPNLNTRGPFKRIFSWQHGRKLNSWEDYNRANKDHGLVDAGDYRPEVQTPDFDTGGKRMIRVDD